MKGHIWLTLQTMVRGSQGHREPCLLADSSCLAQIVFLEHSGPPAREVILPTVGRALQHHSLSKNTPHRLADRPIRRRHFLIQGSFFPDDLSLHKVDKKELASTKVLLNSLSKTMTWRGKHQQQRQPGSREPLCQWPYCNPPCGYVHVQWGRRLHALINTHKGQGRMCGLLCPSLPWTQDLLTSLVPAWKPSSPRNLPASAQHSFAVVGMCAYVYQAPRFIQVLGI